MQTWPEYENSMIQTLMTEDSSEQETKVSKKKKGKSSELTDEGDLEDRDKLEQTDMENQTEDA